jgi:hypothetical protein
MFLESVRVVIGGRTFWVNNDNDFCYRDRDTFGSQEAYLIWRNAGEKQQVTEALIAAHKRGNELHLRPVMNYEAIKAREKASNWKFAFWLLLIVVLAVIISSLL